MTANILSNENDFLTLVIYTPKPSKPPSHSEITAPTTEYDTEILRALKNELNKLGNFNPVLII